MNIKILSRVNALAFKFAKPELLDKVNIISINDTWDKPAFSDTPNILTLFFSDIDEEYYDMPENIQARLILFSDEHMRKIIDFINNMDKERTLLVHCHAGISRSAAVALFVQALYGTEEEFKLMFKQFDICPKRFIFKKLVNYYVTDEIQKRKIIDLFEWAYKDNNKHIVANWDYLKDNVK